VLKRLHCHVQQRRVGDIMCAMYEQLVEILLNARLICTPRLISFGLSDYEDRDGLGMWHMTGKRIGAACSFLVGKPQVKRSFRRPWRGWKDNIETDFQGIVWERRLD